MVSILNTKEVTFPYPWQSQIVSTQILMIGEVSLIAVPGEFTTMSGRRLRNAVKDTVINNGGSKDTRPIITGHSNVYTNYIATYEEYQLQRYEGGSTIFGPHTLNLYINKYKQLAGALMTGAELDAGPTPLDFSSQLISLNFPASWDGTSLNRTFGECLQQPRKVVSIGDVVSVKFASGNPRHNVLHGSTYLQVEKLMNGKWITIATDASWETRYLWKRVNHEINESEVTIEWDIGKNTEPGTYRIKHNGHYKTQQGEIYGYEGLTQNFTVI